jgi:single-stranded-DNA-specific exonuclease
MAAGMSLPEANLEKFRAAFAAEVAARAAGDDLKGIIHSDGELLPDEMCISTARLLKQGGPWGQGFPEPIFDGGFSVADARIVGGKHLKLLVRGAHHAASPGASAPGASSACFDAIAFGYGDAAGNFPIEPEILKGVSVDLAYRLEINEYNGTESVQLNCQHVALR